MPRTNASEVINILGYNYDSRRNTSLDTPIEVASLWVDDLVAAAPEISFEARRLKLIEMYLAAHVYTTTTDPLYSNRSTMSASGGMIRGKTDYADKAYALDPSKKLVNIVNPTASFINMEWLGSNPYNVGTTDL